MPKYRIELQQFCGEEKAVLQKVPAASAQDGVLPCSTCETQPQIEHCAHVMKWMVPKGMHEEVPVYCKEGYCKYHVPDDKDLEMWRCAKHRPKKKAKLL